MKNSHKHIALLLAAGCGNRMNAPLPKQYIEVDGESVLLHTMRAFQRHPLIADIYIVCASAWEQVVIQEAARGEITKFRKTLIGGATSFDSIRNGITALSQLEPADSMVLVHDSVRPLITQDVISRNIAVCLTHGNAITAITSNEAYLQTEDGESSCGYISRDSLMRAQTPHTFPLGQLAEMMHSADERGITDSQSLYTLANELGVTPLYIAQGDMLNFKLTQPSDLLIYQALKNIVE